MIQEDLEPIVIEDLVRFGEDRGFEKGIEKGIEKGRAEGVEGLREALEALLGARGLALTEAQATRIAAERSLETLRAWIRRAAAAQSASQVLGEP